MSELGPDAVGFRVQGLGFTFRVQGLGFRVQGLGFRGAMAGVKWRVKGGGMRCLVVNKRP